MPAVVVALANCYSALLCSLCGSSSHSENQMPPAAANVQTMLDSIEVTTTGVTTPAALELLRLANSASNDFDSATASKAGSTRIHQLAQVTQGAGRTGPSRRACPVEAMFPDRFAEPVQRNQPNTINPTLIPFSLSILLFSTLDQLSQQHPASNIEPGCLELSLVFAHLLTSIDQPARFVLIRISCFPTRSDRADQMSLIQGISPFASALHATHSPQTTQTRSGIKFKFFNRDCRLTV